MLAIVASACGSLGGGRPLQNITAESTDASPIARASMPPDATPPPATPTPTPTATPVQPTPIVVKGKGSQNTKPFDLAGGDSAVVVQGKPECCYSGNVIVDLILTTDSVSSESLTNEISADGSAYTYETNLYGLAPEGGHSPGRTGGYLSGSSGWRRYQPTYRMLETITDATNPTTKLVKTMPRGAPMARIPDIRSMP